MNKKRSYIMFLFIVIVLCALSVGGYTVYNNLISKNESNKIENNNSKINNELTEKEKEDISIKVSEILSFGETSTGDAAFSYLIFSYSLDENKTFIENIEEAKTYSILNSLSTNKMFKVLNEDEANKLNGDYSAADGTIEADIVIDRYKKVFGGNIDYKNIRACPTYKYNTEDKLFYRLTGCGGTMFPGVLVHKNTIEKINDKVIVGLSIATISPDFDNDILNNKIYKGIYLNVLDRVDENSYITTISDKEDVVKYINENYEKFAKYEMTFKMDDNGNYIYESLKKI